MLLKLTKTVVANLQPASKPYDARDADLTGLLLRVHPTGRKVWYFEYRLHGRRTRAQLGVHPGLSPDGARVLAKKSVGKLAEGIDIQKEREQEQQRAARDRVSTLRAFLDERYESWALAHLKTGKEQLERIRSDFKTWLDLPMASLSPFQVEIWRRSEMKRGKKPVTVNRDLQRVRAALARAVDWGLLEKHPIAAVKPLKTDRRGRVRYLSDAEESALRLALIARENGLREARERFNAWRHARGLPTLPPRSEHYVDHVQPMVLLAMNTGLRRGELLSLQWRHVNLAGKTITVVAASAKTGQTRYIPLNREAFDVISQWKAQADHSDLDDYVFAVTRGKRMGSVSTAWESVAKEAKLADFRFHDLRHSFASRLVMSGVALNTVRELLGHTSLEMTLRYSHLSPDNLATAVEKLTAAG